MINQSYLYTGLPFPQIAKALMKTVVSASEKLGVCNFPANMVSSFIEVCAQEYIKPTVYQGIYNIIDRRHEGTVLDLFRKHGMQFVAHSLNASGFLYGALTSGQTKGTWFIEGN